MAISEIPPDDPDKRIEWEADKQLAGSPFIFTLGLFSTNNGGRGGANNSVGDALALVFGVALLALFVYMAFAVVYFKAWAKTKIETYLILFQSKVGAFIEPMDPVLEPMKPLVSIAGNLIAQHIDPWIISISNFFMLRSLEPMLIVVLISIAFVNIDYRRLYWGNSVEATSMQVLGEALGYVMGASWTALVIWAASGFSSLFTVIQNLIGVMVSAVVTLFAILFFLSTLYGFCKAALSRAQQDYGVAPSRSGDGSNALQFGTAKSSAFWASIPILPVLVPVEGIRVDEFLFRVGLLLLVIPLFSLFVYRRAFKFLPVGLIPPQARKLSLALGFAIISTWWNIVYFLN